jgi:apolipoprotein N-acyltransferase
LAVAFGEVSLAEKSLSERLLSPWMRLLWGCLGVGLSTAGLIFAFPPFDEPEMAYVALIPLLLWFIWVRPSWRSVALLTFIGGFAQWVVLLWWLRFFPDQVGLPRALGYLGVTALSAVVALFNVSWALVARWALADLKKTDLLRRLIIMIGLAATWVVLEWIRTWILSGFPWLTLSASQWQRPLLLQVLPLTGAWGLSFVLVLFNLGAALYAWHLVQNRQRAWFRRFCPEFYLGLGGICFVLLLALDRPTTRETSLFSAGFIQPYVKPPDRWNPDNYAALREDFELVAQYARFDGAEVILWPEASTPLPAPGHPQAEAWLAGLSADLEIPILLGNLVKTEDELDGEQWFNAMVMVTPTDGVLPTFAPKRHLVPFGEYVPNWFPFLDKLVPIEGQFTAGDRAIVQIFPVGQRRFRVGPLVCYEDLFPSLSRQLVKKGVDFLYVATNDAWYGEEGAAYQHAAHSVLRAVETRRPVLRSGNAGWSGWIDERGQIRHVLLGADRTVYFQGADAVRIARNPSYVDVLTLYVRWGDWFVLVCGVSLFGLYWARKTGSEFVSDEV